MGIERKESVVVTYTCDRCTATVQRRTEAGVVIETPEGWADLKILDYARSFQAPVQNQRLLCASCAAELQAWFKGAA